MDNKASRKPRPSAVICYCCGEQYSLRKFSRENPLEACGECGAEHFIPFSRDCLRGYLSLAHYHTLVSLLPEHIRSQLPPELCPRQFPFGSVSV